MTNWAVLKQLLLRWDFAYSPFTDFLEMRDQKVFELSDGELRAEAIGAAEVIFEIASGDPMALTMTDAYQYLGDIDDNMTKELVVDKVVKYLDKNYER